MATWAISTFLLLTLAIVGTQGSPVPRPTRTSYKKALQDISDYLETLYQDREIGNEKRGDLQDLYGDREFTNEKDDVEALLNLEDQGLYQDREIDNEKRGDLQDLFKDQEYTNEKKDDVEALLNLMEDQGLYQDREIGNEKKDEFRDLYGDNANEERALVQNKVKNKLSSLVNTVAGMISTRPKIQRPRPRQMDLQDLFEDREFTNEKKDVIEALLNLMEDQGLYQDRDTWVKG